MFVHVRSMNLMFIMEFSDVWRQDLKTTRHQNVIKPWLTEVNEFNRTSLPQFWGWLVKPHHRISLKTRSMPWKRFSIQVTSTVGNAMVELHHLIIELWVKYGFCNKVFVKKVIRGSLLSVPIRRKFPGTMQKFSKTNI